VSEITYNLLGTTIADLSAGDLRYAEFDWTGFAISFVDSITHPRFEPGYAALWDEFGAKNEMEPRSVLARRFAWRTEPNLGDHALNYEMVVIHKENELAGVADHCAIVNRQDPQTPAIVHLSHLLVMPRFRGSGLAGWLRAMPVYAARECLDRAGQPPRAITLVGEMEPAIAGDVTRMRRLSTFQKAGFVKIDPRQVNYLQPDFRPTEVIDATGGPVPVPLSLIIRQIGREHEHVISGREVRQIVQALYAMYQPTFRASDMLPNWQSLKSYPPDGRQIELVPPTQFD
jgi:GNAT superfamily N-acetyltransferase